MTERRPRPLLRRLRSRRALSFIEILVTSAVMVVALVPLFVMSSGSVRTTEVSIDEVLAVNLASELMSQVRLLAAEPGFAEIPVLPNPNPPPDFPFWVPIDDPDSPLYQEGASLLRDPRDDGEAAVVVDTRDWELLGTPVLRAEGSPPDLLIESLSRLYLSDAPEGYERFVKIYLPRVDQLGTRNPDVKRIEIKVRWSRTFMGTPTQEREILLTTLLAAPRTVLR